MSAGRSNAERRRAPRFIASGVFAHLALEGRSVPCHVHNISAGGVSLLARERVKQNADVAINLAMPGWTRVLTVRGRVLDADGPTVRIRLHPLSGEPATLFARMLGHLGEKAHEYAAPRERQESLRELEPARPAHELFPPAHPRTDHGLHEGAQFPSSAAGGRGPSAQSLFPAQRAHAEQERLSAKRSAPVQVEPELLSAKRSAPAQAERELPAHELLTSNRTEPRRSSAQAVFHAAPEFEVESSSRARTPEADLRMEVEGLRGRVRALERSLADERRLREAAEQALERLARELAARR